jgi:hypothetical protein
MSVKVKPGVEFTVIAPAGYLILDSLKKAAKKLCVDLTISSACDGAHSGPGDPHHTGNAYDVRSHDFEDGRKDFVLAVIMAPLGTDWFFGFLEAPGTDNEHWHIQRKKGTVMGIGDFLAFEEA